MMKHFGAAWLFAMSTTAFGCGGLVYSLGTDTSSTAGGDAGADDAGAGDAGTTSSVIAPLRMGRVDKVDLLLMVDNSASMEDKQAELGTRIAAMIAKLTDQTPDPVTGVVSGISDLHIGIVTSSLGSFGTSACDPTISAHNDDRGQLLPRASDPAVFGATPGAPLRWVFDPMRDPTSPFIGDKGAVALGKVLASVVQNARTDGCGYEASLESIYHFLIDPAPYQKAHVDCVAGPGGDRCVDASGAPAVIARSGVDATLLAQRKAFLRPDSTVVVVMLTDENDSSLKPVGQNWIPWGLGAGTMAPGWSACQNIADDQEPDDNASLMSVFPCTSCFLDSRNSSCRVPWPTTKLNQDVDGMNLRAFHQVQRFGDNFLWTRDRYVSAFTQANVVGSDDKLAPNPLFVDGLRDRSQVIFATITGVPEDLVANADHTPKVLSKTDWDRITNPILKLRDSRMWESIAPRPLMPNYKGGGDRSASDPAAGGNGGDRPVPDGDDLQYACIQKRASTPTNNDCADATTAGSNPLCDKQTDGSYRQSYYKAYPGLRQLRVAQALGDSGFVGSICASSYAPMLDGLLAKVRTRTEGTCGGAFTSDGAAVSPHVDATTGAKCSLVEVFASEHGPHGESRCEDITPAGPPLTSPACAKGAPCAPTDGLLLSRQLVIPVSKPDGSMGTAPATPTLDASGNVYVTSSVDSVRHLACIVPHVVDSTCPTTPDVSSYGFSGWCYSNDASVVGSACIAAGALGKVRLLGSASTPANGAHFYLVCE